MERFFVTATIHGGTVTRADLNYKGSITLDPAIVEAAGLLPFELVHINNFRNGVHWETYVIKGAPGEIVLNGPPANHFRAGDMVVINRVASVREDELATLTNTVVYLDRENRISSVETRNVIS